MVDDPGARAPRHVLLSKSNGFGSGGMAPGLSRSWISARSEQSRLVQKKLPIYSGTFAGAYLPCQSSVRCLCAVLPLASASRAASPPAMGS